jgi:hypothetical protein
MLGVEAVDNILFGTRVRSHRFRSDAVSLFTAEGPLRMARCIPDTRVVHAYVGHPAGGRRHSHAIA